MHLYSVHFAAITAASIVGQLSPCFAHFKTEMFDNSFLLKTQTYTLVTDIQLNLLCGL